MATTEELLTDDELLEELLTDDELLDKLAFVLELDLAFLSCFLTFLTTLCDEWLLLDELVLLALLFPQAVSTNALKMVTPNVTDLFIMYIPLKYVQLLMSSVFGQIRLIINNVFY